MVVKTDPPDLRIWDKGKWRRVYYTWDGRGYIPKRLGTPSDWLVSMKRWRQYCNSWFHPPYKTKSVFGEDPELPWEF